MTSPARVPLGTHTTLLRHTLVRFVLCSTIISCSNSHSIYIRFPSFKMLDLMHLYTCLLDHPFSFHGRSVTLKRSVQCYDFGIWLG